MVWFFCKQEFLLPVRIVRGAPLEIGKIYWSGAETDRKTNRVIGTKMLTTSLELPSNSVNLQKNSFLTVFILSKGRPMKYIQIEFSLVAMLLRYGLVSRFSIIEVPNLLTSRLFMQKQTSVVQCLGTYVRVLSHEFITLSFDCANKRVSFKGQPFEAGGFLAGPVRPHIPLDTGGVKTGAKQPPFPARAPFAGWNFTKAPHPVQAFISYFLLNKNPEWAQHCRTKGQNLSAFVTRVYFSNAFVKCWIE